MKMRYFLKDRLPLFGIRAAALALTLIFLGAFRVNGQVCAMVSAVFILTAIAGDAWEFIRKKGFYDALNANIQTLDRKYLIAEMTPRPGFYEGEMVTEVLRAADKSMAERVATHRREAADFREYIEMWVHEVKVPVAGLLLMCHNDQAGERYMEPLRRIDGGIENVLYYARSENPEKDFLFKETSLKRVVADTALKNREAFREKGAVLHTEGLSQTVWTDGKWLEFILGQLLANSLKYASPDREMEISVSAASFPDRTELSIRDNGLGIPREDLPRIFEKSFTGQNGRVGPKSTGMGLYIVKKLCDKMGHGIRAESRRGEYTQVTLTFGKHDLFKVQEE